jgi:hypothetical protein
MPMIPPKKNFKVLLLKVLAQLRNLKQSLHKRDERPPMKPTLEDAVLKLSKPKIFSTKLDHER